MTVMQIVGVCVAVAVAAYLYMPRLKWPASKPSTVRQIESVMSIRDSNGSPEVRKACTALLQALLQ